MLADEDVERQVAVLTVVALEEAALLLAVNRVIGCVEVSMDGKGRWIDNVMDERLWRSVKYEDVYLCSYSTIPALEAGLTQWFERY